MPTTPQDHKPKADAPYTFKAPIKGADGKVTQKTFTIPKLSEDGVTAIPGDITYAAVMAPDDEMAQMRLAFATLEAARPTPATMAALRAFPTGKMLEVVYGWMGESSGSSD